MDTNKTIKPMPENVIIKILAADREGGMEKSFTKEDGTTGKLYTSTALRIYKREDFDNSEFMRPLEDADDGKNNIFVRTGEVLSVGSKVAGIEAGDIAILDYTTDNTPEIVIGYDGEDKIISVKHATTYYPKDEIAYAERDKPRDQILAYKGEILEISSIIAVIRKGKMIARRPYVLLVQDAITRDAKTASGLLYTEKDTVIKRKVVSVPAEEADVQFKDDDIVLVKEADTFDIVLPQGLITACFVTDVMAIC